jgi:hypothetical protein
MQNANLLNLPENYTFKYCTLDLALAGVETDHNRLVSRTHLA